MNRKRFVPEKPQAKRRAFIPFMLLAAVSGAYGFAPEPTVYPQRNADSVTLGSSVMWEIYRGTGAGFLLADILTCTVEGWTRSVRFQITQEF